MKKLAVIGLALSLTGAWAPAVFCEEAASGAGALFEKKCSRCHSTDRPKSKKKTAEEWGALVKRMKVHGAVLTDEETKSVEDFLTKNFGK